MDNIETTVEIPLSGECSDDEQNKSNDLEECSQPLTVLIHENEYNEQEGVETGEDDNESSEHRFLDKDAVISLLLETQSNVSHVPTQDLINHYFILDDSSHFVHGKRVLGKNNFAAIDGFKNWGNMSIKTLYYVFEDEEYKHVEYVGGQFFRINPRTKSRTRIQPHIGSVVIIKKVYASLEGKMKRRVTYFEKWPTGVEPAQKAVILVEYLPDSSEKKKIDTENNGKIVLDISQDISSEITLDEEILEGGVINEGGESSNGNLESVVGPSRTLEVTESFSQEPEDQRQKMGVDNGGMFLEKNKVIGLLLEGESSRRGIPRGQKENEYLLIDNEENDNRVRQGKRRVYEDDCGAWKSVSMCKQPYTMIHGEYVQVEYRNGHYISMNNDLRQNKKIIDKWKVLTIRRTYATLKRDEEYRRRITWIEAFPRNVKPKQAHIALVEYTGTYPGNTVPHGNQKKPGAGGYIRTPISVMEELRTKVATKTAKEILSQYSDVQFSRRDVKQLQNLRYRSTLRVCAGAAKDSAHMADLTNIINMVHEHPFLQQAIYTKHKPPSIIAYTNQQMNTFRYYCNEKSGFRRCAGIDRTINIGPTHLTMLMYSHINLLVRRTNLPAVMVGPIMIHMDTSWDAYMSFFTNIQTKLNATENTTIDDISISCIAGEHKAIQTAINQCFPNANSGLSMVNLKNDVKTFLLQDAKLQPSDVEIIADDIFTELMRCEDEYNFDMKVLQLQSEYDANIPQISHYFRELAQDIKQNLWIPSKAKESLQWSTHSCEALYNFKKFVPNWEKLRLPEVILRIYEVIRLQEEDELRALYDEGNFVLAPHAKRYEVDKQKWLAKTAKQKTRSAENLRRIKPAMGAKGTKRKTYDLEEDSGSDYEPTSSRYSTKKNK